jgi:hypothetical protein
MKIVNEGNVRFPRELHQVKSGDCVEFERTFHQKHRDGAKFLVLSVPAEYIKADKRYRDSIYRIMVANVETGSASLVDAERRVCVIEAEVVIK